MPVIYSDTFETTLSGLYAGAPVVEAVALGKTLPATFNTKYPPTIAAAPITNVIGLIVFTFNHLIRAPKGANC